MRTCEYRNCGKAINGVATKRYCTGSRCRMAENRARERSARLLAELYAPVDDEVAERIYLEAEAEVLRKVKRARGRMGGEAIFADHEWVKFVVREHGVVADGIRDGEHLERPFQEQDERVKRDARRVPRP